MSWYVLYTKARSEKKTEKLLVDKGIEVYCPIVETVKQWSDRKKKTLAPVFRSYIFVNLENYGAEQVKVLNTQGAVRFLWWAGKPGVVRDAEINLMRDFLKEYRGAEITVDVQEGDEVVIGEGVLNQKKGKVLKIKGNTALLELKSIGWRLTAKVAIQKLEKIITKKHNLSL